jgi:hypothetical protein
MGCQLLTPLPATFRLLLLCSRLVLGLDEAIGGALCSGDGNCGGDEDVGLKSMASLT